MAAPEPTEEDIDLFCALTTCTDRRDALDRIKGNNHNVQQAIGEWFDNPESRNRKTYNNDGWNESHFNSDRDGGGNNHGISFTIESSDDPAPYGHLDSNVGAPSRPPSRTSNNKSPISNVIDLTMDGIDQSNGYSNYDQNDSDLQQALAASRAEAGMAPQETGITGTDKVYFGPANRAEYNPGEWGMVSVTKTTTQEILLDPEPDERKRDLDAPAFLKPGIEGHRLGALLTIYHEIPIMREIFIDRADLANYYPYNRDWWTGKPIEVSGANGLEDQIIVGEERRFNMELQRIMAFLDKTDRSYGSADVLAQLPIMKKRIYRRGVYGGDVETIFFEVWKEIFLGTGVRSKVFSKGISPAITDSDGEPESKEFAILDMGLPPRDSAAETLYDLADDILWPKPTLEYETSPYLSRIGDTIAFRLDGDESCKSIEIPAIWYPDRYLESSRQAALQMRLQKNDIEEQLISIDTQEYNLIYHTSNSSNKIIKVKDMLNISLKHDSPGNDEAGDNQISNSMDANASDSQSSKNAYLSNALRELMASIDEKLEALTQAKEKARASLRELSKLYTEPSDDPSEPTLHRYTLRGVSTTKNTTYVCRRAEPDLIDMGLDEDSKPKEDQWWRIEYPTSGARPTVEKTTEESVLYAARYESNNAILVYANQKAMEWNLQALPRPLEVFTELDNEAFREELKGEDSQSSVTSPRSPGKRKFDQRSDSSDESKEPKWSASDIRQITENAPNVKISTRELNSYDESGATSGSGGYGPIMGVNPFDDPNQAPEMQEMKSLREMSSPYKGSTKQSTLDNMDIDEVVEDDDVLEESAAVKRVGFSQ